MIARYGAISENVEAKDDENFDSEENESEISTSTATLFNFNCVLGKIVVYLTIFDLILFRCYSIYCFWSPLHCQ